MFSGLLHIYTRGFSHRDLKPENILLDVNYNIKIVDFGFACKLSGRDGKGLCNSTVGTPGYMAPEIIERKPYQGHVADIFSLGVILFCIVVGYPPFEYAIKDDPYYKYIYINRMDLFWKVHKRANPNFNCSDEFKELIAAMLLVEPLYRPSFTDIIGFVWLS